MNGLKDKTLLSTVAYVGREWCAADHGGTIVVRNPATGQKIASVSMVDGQGATQAIALAEESFRTWRETTAEHRAHVLRRWYDLMKQNTDDLALILMTEQGKPLSEAKSEIDYAASYVEWFAEEARRVYGDLIPSPLAGRDIVVKKEPVGVCAAITPWNFPAAMITRKVAPALAAGCTIVVKPAQQTPLTAIALAELATRAGIPAGAFSVVNGDAAEIGGVLTSSTLVRKLTFTGSTGVGRLLAAQCAPTLKRMSLELGGNAPFIVFDDADVDAAVEGAIAAKYRNSGQTCVCANRFLVQDDVFEAFSQRLKAAVEQLHVGDGSDPRSQLGPLIDMPALAKVEELVEHARCAGARVLTGGRRHALGGTFYEPTVLVDVSPTWSVVRNEIFGPVAPPVRFKTEADAITIANDSEFGLASYLYSRDLARVWRVADAIEAGMVGVNTGLISTAVAPFGGVKQSGMGREGSKYGIEEYLDTKYVCLGGLR